MPAGRPTKFNDETFQKIIELARQGKTEKEIAEIIGVSQQTLINWKWKDLEFLYSFREAKQEADQIVEAALFRRATGYSHPETKILTTQDGGVVVEEVIKYYPPDSTAAKFWLMNRKARDWKEKTEVEQTVEVKGVSAEDIKQALLKDKFLAEPKKEDEDE